MPESNSDMRSIIQGAVGACVVRKGSIAGIGKYPSDAIIRRIFSWAEKSKSNSKDSGEAGDFFHLGLLCMRIGRWILNAAP
jgi:hypothetical protein